MTDFSRRPVRVTVNGQPREIHIEPRRLLSDAVRHDLGLTGTNVGCEHGLCGACTVLVDGEPQRSCLIFAIQVDGASITTVEGLATTPGELTALQRCFQECHGLQCGFCTPGFLITATDLLARLDAPTERDVREGLVGNICRCTGYQSIVDAVLHCSAGDPS